MGYFVFGVKQSHPMAFAESTGIYKLTLKHQSLLLTLYYFGSDVRSDTSLFQIGLLTDGQ